MGQQDDEIVGVLTLNPALDSREMPLSEGGYVRTCDKIFGRIPPLFRLGW